MICRDITAKCQSYLDGELDAEMVGLIERHLMDCNSCRQTYTRERNLRSALRQLPVLGPRPGFLERALKEAAVRHQRRRYRWIGLGFGGGLAAGLAIWMVIGLMTGNHASIDYPLAQISVKLNEVHNVNLAINARRELRQAQLTIILPENMEMAAFPGRHQLSWHTDLKAGNNLLQLPIVAHGLAGGVLVTRITHQNQSETLRIRMDVRTERQSETVRS